MAEQIPFGVASSLIYKLASVAFIEIGRIYGVSDKLDELKKTLDSIHIVLSDAERRQSEDPVIKHWISRFKQVLHDADDLLDDLAIKDWRRKVGAASKTFQVAQRKEKEERLNGQKEWSKFKRERPELNFSLEHSWARSIETAFMLA